MLDLGKMRDEIDVIDSEIVRLFEKRMKICENVAQFKIETGKPVFDKSREQDKLKTLGAKAGSDFNRCGVEELFQQIMSISRKRQYQLLQENGIEEPSDFTKIDFINKENVTVVYQGVEGAYSYGAMKTFFGEDVKNYHVATWKDAMEEIKFGRADYAVLPIENSTAGIVQDNYDLLTKYDHVIVGEQIIRCQHVLTALPGATLSDIRTVYSHPQALMQCREFLDAHKEWHQKEWSKYAAAAKKVSEEHDLSQAAISSSYAAEYFGLNILSENIFTNSDNSTRFIIVAKKKFTQKMLIKSVSAMNFLMKAEAFITACLTLSTMA